VLGALVVSGCAFQQAMRDGNRAADGGDWRTAYSAYDQAVKTKPGNEEAKHAHAVARDNAVEDALGDAEASLELRQYERVADTLEYVRELDRDRPEVFHLKNDLSAALQYDFDRTWDAGEHRIAYQIAVLTTDILPDAGFLAEALQRSRAHFMDDSRRLLDDGQHEEALDTLNTIPELEPSRAGDVTALEQQIRISWADALVARAKSKIRGKREGAASVLFARAYEIAGRRSDIDQARGLADQLRSAGQFTLRTRVYGELTRGGALRDEVNKALPNISDAAVGTTSASDVTMALSVFRARCSESKQVTPTTKEYVSGQVEKPNPLWADLTARKDQAREIEMISGGQVGVLAPQLKSAQDALAAFDNRAGGAQAEFDGVQAKIDRADSQLKAAQELRDNLLDQLDNMQQEGASAEAIAQWEGKLAEQTGRVNEWQAVVVGLQNTQAASRQELDALAIERVPAAEAVARLQVGFDAASGDRATAQSDFAQLTAQLAQTDKTIWEDVYDTFRYDVVAWTRTCSAPITVKAAPRWDTLLGGERKFGPEATTTDTSHVGFDKAGIPTDPKVYPASDDQLIAQADAANAMAIIGWANELADDHFSTVTVETVVALQRDPDLSTTDLVGLFVGAPHRLDQQTVNTFATHLRQHYGLENAELLRGGVAAPNR